MQTAVGLVLRLRAQAQVGTGIVEPIVVDVIDILSPLGVEQHAVHTHDDLFAVLVIGANGVPFAVDAPAPLRDECIVLVIDERKLARQGRFGGHAQPFFQQRGVHAAEVDLKSQIVSVEMRKVGDGLNSRLRYRAPASAEAAEREARLRSLLQNAMEGQ